MGRGMGASKGAVAGAVALGLFSALLSLSTVVVAAPADEPIAIVSLNSDISPDGTFSYNYETANGITAEVQGTQKDPETVSVKGSFSFTGDDGQKYSVSYTAGEEGFVPTGDHLPKIPEEILRSLEFNAKNPEPDEQGPPPKG